MKNNDVEDKEDSNVFKLLSQLRKEKLFVVNEKFNIQKLNKLIQKRTDSVVKSAWIASKQKLHLINQRDFTSLNYEYIKGIENAKFLEAKRVLDFQHAAKLESLLHVLREQPEQLANWLLLGEQLPYEATQYLKILQTIITSIYSSCIFPEDINYILKLLHQLAKLQLMKCENPRRMLKQSTSCIKNLYFIFTEVLPSAKDFLSAALELPILRLLSSEDFYLDIDPEKSLMRFKHNDLNREYRDVQEYRNHVVAKLSEFTNNVICSLHENVYSFPKPIAWIVDQISKIITKSFGSKEANMIVTELIFTLYICPALIDPEQYFICDLQISDVCQHNLMQIAQILQALALQKYESPDSRYNDIYNLVNNTSVCNFMEDILFNSDCDDSLSTGGDTMPQVSRDCVLLSEDELNNLVMFLQRVYNDQSHNLKKETNRLIEEHVSALMLPPSLENSPKTNKSYSNGFSESSSVKRPNFLTLVTKNSAPRLREDTYIKEPSTTVLIFSLEKDIAEPIGCLCEEKVLNLNRNVKNTEATKSNEIIKYANFPDEGGSFGGNTSDNLEAISEAASNHSVDSSLELENEDQNDNLSDMISANVSGRGTPNISGRDTPSSQVNDIEERPLPEARQPTDVPPPSSSQISRQIRSEIDDKFCKFEIKKLVEGDETISIISETWSTDVLASDNENIDTAESMRDRPIIMEMPSGSSCNNMLDMSETQSESAWSTDVMASDNERMTEVDNDDTGSVAQSDETRSEIDENILPNRRFVNYVNYQEYRKIDVKTDNNANNVVFKSLTQTTYNNCSNRIVKDAPSTSSFGSSTLVKQNSYEDRPNEILLSNLSLNSSSSGSSSNSFENNKQTCDQWESKQWLNSSGSSLNATSTPSESTSELSVLSVSNMNHTTNTKKSTTTVSKNLKPSASTGAIPKSISFDMSADKGGGGDDDQRNKRGSFFGKLKIGFRNRRGKSFRNLDDYRIVDGEDLKRVNKASDNAEDILAKYRNKSFMDCPIKNSTNNVDKATFNVKPLQENDVNNSFDDIKKKLRLVLCLTTSSTCKIVKENRLSVKSKLKTVLRLNLGKARKLKEWSNIARISETLRLVNLLNESTCLDLIHSLQDDYLKRSIYIDYLVFSKQDLLLGQSYLESLSQQINNDKQQSEKYLSIIYVRKFVIEQEYRIQQFCDQFKEITMSDEKCDYLNNFYKQLYSIMESGLWQEIFKSQGDVIKISLERCIMSKIYKYALYPNGDGDRDRDHVLYQHINKLANIITPHNKDLMIDKMYLREMPWIPAQDALKAMNAYKTPSDKINCVVHCAKCIMDLLSFSQNCGSTTADDFTPVLVYVIIKVNPSNLLSTIQFVNAFYQNQIGGEELYWWTQFSSAVEYIKTMDYSD